MNVNDFCDVEVPAAKLACGPKPPTLSPSSKSEPVSSVLCSSRETCGLFDSQPPSLVPNKDSSDMELTLIESASKETHTHECTSLLSPNELLKGIPAAKTNSSTCGQTGSEVNASTNRGPTRETSTMDLTCMEAEGPSTDDTTSPDLETFATSTSVDVGLNLKMSETLQPSSRHVIEIESLAGDDSQHQANLTNLSAGCKAATSQLHPTTMPHLQADTDVDGQFTKYPICTKGNTNIEDILSRDGSEEGSSQQKLQSKISPSAGEKAVELTTCQPRLSTCSHTDIDIDMQLTTYQSCAMSMTCTEETEVITSPEKQQTDYQNVKTSDLTASKEPEATPQMSALSTATASHSSITRGTHSTNVPLKPQSYQSSYSKANHFQSHPMSKPLVVASPFIRTLKCTPSFLPPQGSGLPTPLGLPSTLCSQIRNRLGCSNKVGHISLPTTQLPYHTAPVSTSVNSDRFGQTPTPGTVGHLHPVAEVKPVPSYAVSNDGPSETEHSHPSVAPLETSLPQTHTTTDANWLQTTADNSFSLIGSSPESNHSPTDKNGMNSSNLPSISSQVIGSLKDIPSSHHLNDTYNLSRPLLNAQALPGVQHHESPPSNQEISLLRKTVDKLKVNTEQAGDDTIRIETPKMVPLDQITDLQRASLDSSSPLSCSTADIAHHTLSESILMQQSLAMSPSAFSKFLAALKCDKSMSFFPQSPPEKPPLEVCHNIFNTTATPMGHNSNKSSTCDEGDFSAMGETHGTVVTATPQQTNNHEPTIIPSQSPDGEGSSSCPSTQPSTNPTCSKESQLSREQRNPVLFSDHLQELHTRQVQGCRASQVPSAFARDKTQVYCLQAFLAACTV